jgi:secondary thiamine-phosphate synthase enzyme
MPTLSFGLKKGIDFVDITPDVEEIVRKSGIREGVCSLFSPGSTSALAVNENEADLVDDFKKFLQKVVPEGGWSHPQNAASHLMAGLLGPSQAIPIENGSLALGTWQSIFIVNLDTVPRERKVIVKIVKC